MKNFQKIYESRKILGLGETATISEIKKAYKKLVLNYHPDRCGDKDKKKCEDMFKKITLAYDTLMTYCESYRFSFSGEDFEKLTADGVAHDHVKRFYDGWII